MAGKGYSTIQLLGDDESDEELIDNKSTSLQFQEFSNSVDNEDDIKSLGNKSLLQSSLNESAGEDDQAELLSQNKKSPPFWTFEYYQAFFDVDTNQVVSRIMYSMIPSKTNFLLTKIRPNPDLYGPFWVCATLVFTIAICGNLSSFFASDGTHQWKSDFRLVSLSATVIFLYAWLIPTCIWGFLTWRGNRSGFTYLEIVCVYGYSLAVFVPISILWLLPFDWLRWVLVLVGAITSGLVIVSTFWRAVEDEPKNIAFGLLAVVFFLHALLAVGFKLYFFKTNQISPSPPPPAITTLLPTTTTTTAQLAAETTKAITRKIIHTTLKAITGSTTTG